MDFVAPFLLFSLHIFYFVVAAKIQFSPYNQRKLKLQSMYERAISEGRDAMELSGVMLHAKVLNFCLFSYAWVFVKYCCVSRVYHNLKGKEYQESDLSRIAISRSDATFFRIRGQISLVRRFGPMGNFLG